MMILFDRVSLAFENKIVLNEFSLQVRPGDRVLISGKSGIGKSTLLRMLLGFLQPREGAVHYKGQAMSPEVAARVRRDAAYVSQSLDIGQGKVGAFLDEIFSYKVHHGRPVPERIRDSIRRFLELPDGIEEERLDSLSGGEKQRVALWTALMTQRKLLLLDEVTSQLDRDMKEKVADYLLSLKGCTMICISHDACWKQAPSIRRVTLGG